VLAWRPDDEGRLLGQQYFSEQFAVSARVRTWYWSLHCGSVSATERKTSVRLSLECLYLPLAVVSRRGVQVAP